MQLNNYEVIDRHNRPTTLQRVGLRLKFFNDGAVFDPYAISAVTVFPIIANASPSSILDSTTRLISANVTSLAKMNWQNSSTLVTNSIFNASNYTPGTTASGIYRVATGEFVVVLDGSVSLSSNYSGAVTVNQCSTVGDYLDVWTVKTVQNSDWQVFVQQFHLYDDTVFTTTEPLLLTCKSKLVNKHIKLGSKIDLQVYNEVTVGNREITESIRNIFKQSAITSASLEIKKINEDSNLPSRVTVSSFSNTVGYVDVTAGDTFIFNWDTDSLRTHANLADFGGLTGVYSVQVKFTLVNQTFYSDLMYIVVS